MSDRLAQLRDNLARFEVRLAAACHAAGRRREEITVVAITKTFPAADVRRLVDLGVRDIGENRDQEARPKATELAELDITWHFVGQLQTNKCASIATYAHLVHSVDRERVVTALDRGAHAANRRLNVLIQLALDDDPGRGGAGPTAVTGLADRVAESANLRLAGVMAVAPLGRDPRPAFDQLARVAAEVRSVYPAATAVSAGMSGDLEAAVDAGATHVRIGTALLGGRSPRVR